MTVVRYTLKQLEYLVATAEAGTFRAAAERCHVSPAGLALAISELERALGIQLLVRRKAKGITVTPAGRQALIRARAVLGQAEELQLEAEANGGQLSGRLDIGCFTSLAPFYIPPLLHTFSARHPRLQLRFAEDSHDRIQRRLLEGEFEVALLYERKLHPDLDYRLMTRLRPHVLLAADHPLAGRDSLRLEDLAGIPVIRPDLPPMSDTGIRTEAPVTHEERYHSPNPELVRCLVGRGLGYAIVVHHPPGDLTYDGRRVASVPIAGDVQEVSVVLAHPRGTTLTARAEALAEFCTTAAR